MGRASTSPATCPSSPETATSSSPGSYLGVCLYWVLPSLPQPPRRLGETDRSVGAHASLAGFCSGRSMSGLPFKTTGRRVRGLRPLPPFFLWISVVMLAEMGGKIKGEIILSVSWCLCGESLLRVLVVKTRTHSRFMRRSKARNSGSSRTGFQTGSAAQMGAENRLCSM